MKIQNSVIFVEESWKIIFVEDSWKIIFVEDSWKINMLNIKHTEKLGTVVII